MNYIFRYSDPAVPFVKTSYSQFEKYILSPGNFLRDHEKVAEMLSSAKVKETYIFEIDDNGWIYIPISKGIFLFVYAFSVQDAWDKIAHLFDTYPFLQYIKEHTPEMGNRYT